MNVTTEATARRTSDASEFVTFRVGALLAGIDIRHIHEINRQVDVTPVPHAPAFVRGVVNLRGDVVTVVDLRAVLGLPAIEVTRQSRNVVVTLGEERTGLLVDSVADAVSPSADQLEPPPPNVHGVEGRFFEGVYKLQDELLVILNMDGVLASSLT